MTEPEHVWEQPPWLDLYRALEPRTGYEAFMFKPPPDTSWVTTEWVGRDLPGLTPIGTHPDLLVDLGRSKVPCPCSACRKTRANLRRANWRWRWRQVLLDPPQQVWHALVRMWQSAVEPMVAFALILIYGSAMFLLVYMVVYALTH